MLIFTSY